MDSFLSLVLKRLVCETGVSEAVVPDALTPEGLVNWKAVARCLPAEEQEHGDAPAYFMHCARALAPWFNTAHRHHGRLSQNDSVRFLQVFEKHTQWTSSPSCALRLARELPQCAGCGERVLEWFLLYFPLLERSLGDVFLCRGRQCPSLLKDLLLTTELRTLLSVTAMRLLRVLIGPPISLNLRNVLWHGFPKPGEIPEQYAWVMFCLLPSLGKLLEENGLQPSEIPHRDFLSLSPFQSDHVIFSELDTADYSDLIERSELIPAEMKALWRLSVVRFESAQFGACASILLPQLEHVLRLLFAEQNGCAERVRTAETAEFFTTFDEMLVKVLPDGAENQLLRALTPGLLHLLLDLLHHPEGPRVRDRLSHGEVDADQVPEQVAQSVIAACCALLSLNCGPQAVARFGLSEYEAQFHPVSLLRKTILLSARQLNDWASLPRPGPGEMDVTCVWDREETYHEVSRDLQRCVQAVEASYHVADCLPHCRVSVLNPDLEICLRQWLCAVRVNTPFRYSSDEHDAAPMRCASEAEVVGLLRRICHQVAEVSVVLSETAGTRLEQWRKKELRSRQRNTYRRMLDSVPCLSAALRLIVIIAAAHYVSLDAPLARKLLDDRTVKLYRALLRCAENIRTNCGVDRNRWEESVQLCQDLMQRVGTL